MVLKHLVSKYVVHNAASPPKFFLEIGVDTLLAKFHESLDAACVCWSIFHQPVKNLQLGVR